MYFSRRAMLTAERKNGKRSSSLVPKTSQDESVIVEFFGRKFEIVWKKEIFSQKIVTWGVLAHAAFHQFLHSPTDTINPTRFKGVELVGIWDPVFQVRHELKEEISPWYLTEVSVILNSVHENIAHGIYNRKSDGKKQVIYRLLAEGPIRTIPDYLLQYLATQFLTFLDVSRVMQTCRRLHRVLGVDDVWDMIVCPSIEQSYWQGIGSAGDEEIMWESIRAENGFASLASKRLRWLFHHSSKMKLFYGFLRGNTPTNISMTSSLWEKLSASFLTIHSLYRTTTDATLHPSTISVIGLSTEMIARKFMQKLHYVIPSTATKYHLLEQAITILPDGYVLGMESSPHNSRTRLESHFDPGTRIETNAKGTVEYRRIGDETFSFVQCYYDNLIQENNRDCQQTWQLLSQKAMANIIVLEYNPPQHRTVYDTIKEMIVHGMCKHSKDVPILIMLCLPAAYSSAYFQANDPLDHDVLQENLRTIAKMMEILVPYNIPWYIQPFELSTVLTRRTTTPLEGSNAIHTVLSHGYYAGLNWLCITLQRMLLHE